MTWNLVPTEFPSITYPIGAVLEDDNGVYKILSEPEVQGFAHKYKVECLKQKKDIPQEWKPFVNTSILIVLAQNVANIKRIE